ncbi:MAG TPA: bifunctional DNA-formamidopyrimidine glycosylase/DNA-(apurinic or apyrimidinic site) lyase [Vicinamibacteria bacterium]|nr:bifunctional DNA-formamidopyrimidine glycosylase/DNA-(apurinic or apyrimidinic site) lyase [Vicinamibacteria bacterium]
MPELPEVEITRRQIEPLLLGRRVVRVTTTAPSPFFLTSPRTLRRRLTGRRFERLERLGKYLLAGLDGGSRLLLHLGMTGQIFAAGVRSVRLLASTRGGALTPEGQARGFIPDRHTHLRLSFDDSGPDVFFRDARKFGRVELLSPGATSPRLERLGPDALSAGARELAVAVRRRRAPIKAVLLDQSVLAGVGNIYADEALFLSSIRPSRRAYRVTGAECDRLLGAIQAVLHRSLETGGSSISDFVQPSGEDGRYQDERRVYGREGEPCPRCRTPIVRTVIAGRGTHHCPRCQR